MEKKVVARRILAYEGFGFALVLAVFIAMELFDIPFNILGGERTPVNLPELILEVLVLLLSGLLIFLLTWRLLGRIKHLEGLIPVCVFCRRIRIDTGWLTLESYVKQYSDADLSPALCPACAIEHYMDFLKKHRGDDGTGDREDDLDGPEWEG